MNPRIVFLLVGLWLSSPLSAQDAPDALSASARWRTYLDRRPTHPRAFDELLAAAVEARGVPDLMAHYRERAMDPSDRAAQIVLARLLGWSGEHDAALALLGPLGETESELLEIRARLSAEHGDADEAQRLLRRAHASARDDAGRERALRGLAEVQRRAGAFALARETLLELASAWPRDGPLQADVAGLLAEIGGADDALQLYARALELAQDDVPRRCTVLAALGRLQEREQLGREALASHAELLSLIGPDHWMRAEALARTIDLHAVGGTLDEWVDARRVELAAARTSRAVLDIAAALDVLGRNAEATTLLAQARTTFPKDEALADALLDLARRCAAHDEVVTLLRERVETSPDDLEKRLAWAQALRTAGHDAAARRAFEEAAEGTPDANGLRRVAGAAAAADLGDTALSLLQRAAESAPNDPHPWLDQARLHAAAERSEPAGRALGEAAGRADAETLLAIAQVWMELGETARAADLLRRAARDERTRAAALDRLAGLYEDGADALARRAALWELAVHVEDARRTLALARWAATFEAGDAAEAALVAVSVQAGGDAQLEHLARAVLAAHLRQTERAVDAYRAALAAEPDAHATRAALIEVLARAERLEEALAEQRTLVVREPRLRGQHLLACASLSLRLRRQGEALATLGRARQALWDSAPHLRTLAARYLALRRRSEALDVLERVLQLEPDDADTAWKAARLAIDARRPDAARRYYLSALRVIDGADSREALLGELHRSLQTGAPQDARIAELAARTRDNPYDREAPELLVSLLRAERRYAELEEYGGLLVERRPDDRRWRQSRARGRLAIGDVPGALADLDWLLGDGLTALEVVECVATELLRVNEPQAAVALGRRVDDLQGAVGALQRRGAQQAAADVATGFAHAHGLAGDGVLDLLLSVREELRDLAFLLTVLEAVEARDGLTVVLAHRLGSLHHKLGDPARVRAYGRVLIDLGASARLVESYYTRHELSHVLAADRAAEDD